MVPPPTVSPASPPFADGPTYEEVIIGSGSFAEKVTFAYPPPPGSPNYDAFAAVALAHNFGVLDKFCVTHGISDLLSPFALPLPCPPPPSNLMSGPLPLWLSRRSLTQARLP